MLPMTSLQAARQDSLRDALNEWLDKPSKKTLVMDAIANGGRMDLPARAGSEASILSNCSRLVFTKSGWDDIVEFCGENVAWASALGADGASPLHHAAACGNAKGIDALRSMGSPASIFDASGLAPIHRLCLLEDPGPDARYAEALQVLLAMWPAGAASSSSEGSPIHCASKSGCWPAVALLNDAGADLSERDPSTGMRPIDIACSLPKTGATARALAEAGVDVELDPLSKADGEKQLSPLRACVSKAWVDTAKSFLALGASLETPSGRLGGEEEPSIAALGASVAQGGARDLLSGLLQMQDMERKAFSALEDKPALAERVLRRRSM